MEGVADVKPYIRPLPCWWRSLGSLVLAVLLAAWQLQLVLAHDIVYAQGSNNSDSDDQGDDAVLLGLGLRRAGPGSRKCEYRCLVLHAEPQLL